MEIHWYVLFAIIGIISAWVVRYWGIPILLRCCNICIKKVLTDELDKMDKEEEKIYKKLTNPKVLVDEESGELYFDGQMPPSQRRRSDDGDDDDYSTDDEKKSDDDIESARKSSIRSVSKLSDRKLSFQEVIELPKKTKSKPSTRNPFKLAKIQHAIAEREAFQAAIRASVKIPTKEEKISMGIHNFKSKFIYNVESEVGWHLTRDQVLCMTKETRENLYKMPTSPFFHKISRRNKKKARPSFQPEWDAATSVDGNDTWKLKRKHAKLWRLKTVIGMMSSPPTVILKTVNRKREHSEPTFEPKFTLNDFPDTTFDDTSSEDIARSESNFSG